MTDTIIIATGNLGRAPERVHTAGGKALVKGSLAVQQGRDDTAWYDLVVWHDDAPSVGGELGRLEKGRRVDVVGRLQMRSWTDRDGAARTTPTITVDRVHPWPPKDGATAQRPPQQRASAERQRERHVSVPPPTTTDNPPFSDDEDIPF